LSTGAKSERAEEERAGLPGPQQGREAARRRRGLLPRDRAGRAISADRWDDCVCWGELRLLLSDRPPRCLEHRTWPSNGPVDQFFTDLAFS